MIKFDNMKYDHVDQELHLKNLSMGSLLIILPFCPNLRKLTLKYPLRYPHPHHNHPFPVSLKVSQKYLLKQFHDVDCGK